MASFKTYIFVISPAEEFTDCSVFQFGLIESGSAKGSNPWAANKTSVYCTDRNMRTDLYLWKCRWLDLVIPESLTWYKCLEQKFKSHFLHTEPIEELHERERRNKEAGRGM